MKRTISRSIPLLLAGFLLFAPVLQGADPDSGATRKEKREQARQERIAKYLKKKEERKAAKEKVRSAGNKASGEETKASSSEQAAQAVPQQQPEKKKQPEAKAERSGKSGSWFSRRKRRRAVEPSTAKETPKAKRGGRAARAGAPAGGPADRTVAQVLETLRSSILMRSPEGRDHLEAVEQNASSGNLASFAAYLADRGYLPGSVSLFHAAAKADPENPALWLNLGTVQFRSGQYDRAAQSFQRTLKLDPNNAWAHYNLGAVFAENDYDRAIREFATALTLDPSLGDPKVNPQAANNDLLVPVKLMLYKSQAGSVALPLAPLKENPSGS